MLAAALAAATRCASSAHSASTTAPAASVPSRRRDRAAAGHRPVRDRTGRGARRRFRVRARAVPGRDPDAAPRRRPRRHRPDAGLLVRVVRGHSALRGAGRRHRGGRHLARPGRPGARRARSPGGHGGGDPDGPRGGRFGGPDVPLGRAHRGQRLGAARDRRVPESRAFRQDRGRPVPLRPLRADDPAGLRGGGAPAGSGVDRVHRVLLPAPRPLPQGRPRHLAVHASHRPRVRPEIQRHRRRAQRPREGDARGRSLPGLPPRALRRLVPRDGGLQRGRGQDHARPPAHGRTRLLAARLHQRDPPPDRELRAGLPGLGAHLQEPGALRLRGRLCGADGVRDGPPRPPGPAREPGHRIRPRRRGAQRSSTRSCAFP